MADSEVADINTEDESKSLEDLTVYEVVTEYQGAHPTSTTSYPHIFLQLRDAQIINVENGEIIISLSQFVATEESAEPCESDTTSIFLSQTSSRPLFIDSEYITSTQERQEVAGNDDIAQPPLLNQSLLGHEESVVAESTMEDVEEEVIREVRSLISDPLPVGWLDNERRMVYNTNESEWGSNGISDEEMINIKNNHVSKIPTNADCVKYLYGHEEVDDPRVPDHIHYRRCKRPTTLEEVYRRWSFILRRQACFARPAINIGGIWFPELYLPDPEDQEWSRKEGIEVDRPAQSLYQLNEGKVFWDPFKHASVNGTHPYYKWPLHENCIDRSVPPNPIRHVKNPTEQFNKFGIEHFPHSHFTTREPADMVQYHPMYSGFRPLWDGTTHDLVDLIQGNAMFWPPKNQEWFISSTKPDTPQLETDNVLISRLSATTVENHFDTDDMLPYLSPTSLFAKEEEAVKRRTASNWGGYDNGSSTRQDSLQRWQEQGSEGRTSHRSTTPNTTISRELIVTTSPTSTTANQAPTISGTYIIPKLSKQGIQFNKANELAAKVSPQAKTILPKPPSTVPGPRSLWNTSGLRSQKKKK